MIKKQIAEQMEKMRKHKKGFTLIELTVVIAIIGVLAALLVPSMMGYINDTKVVKNEANARTIFTAAQATQAGLISPLEANTVIKGVETEDQEIKEFIEKLKDLLGNGFIGNYEITIGEKGAIQEVIYCIATKENSDCTHTNKSDMEHGTYPPSNDKR